MLNGLSFVNIELSSKCNKNCWMCGRRKYSAEYQDDHFNQFIDLNLLNLIKKQIPTEIPVAFHSNGEPTLHPELGSCLKMFENNIRVLDTNGKMLIEKADQIINNLETITISIFEKDPEWLQQWEILKEFIKIKGERKPRIILRCLGNIEKERMDLYESTGLLIAKRILHSPKGSFNYQNKVTIPEIGICLEVLSKLVIDVNGNVRSCVRFDPNGEFIIGNIKNQTLDQIWNSEERKKLIKLHVDGQRDQIKFCSKCQYWGCPTGN